MLVGIVYKSSDSRSSLIIIMTIEGKTAIITGGVKNLGAETAKELAKNGVNLFLQYRLKPLDFDALLAELRLNGVQVETYQTSLNTAKEVALLYEEALKRFPKGIDFAINNVGKVLKKPITEFTEEEFDEMDLANNKSAFFFIKEAGLHLNKNGRIVSLVTSLLAAYTPFYGLYQGTKAPVEYYSKAASKELHSKGITSNCVAPGPMNTEFLLGSEKKEDVEFYKTVGLGGRLTELSDIVPIIKFLISEGGWITGQTIYALGGFTAH